MKAVPSSEYSPETIHDLGYRGEGMIVAVLDLGIDNNHPALEGSFVAGADFSVPESPLTPRDGSYDPDDRVGHGTGVASVLASRGDDSGNYKGIAPEAGIIDLKMSDLNPAYQRAMAEAMDWCIEHKDADWGNGNVGIDVISMSALAEREPDGAIAQLQRRIAEEGIPFIQAAGNDGVQHGEEPATYWWSDDAIIVGGLDVQGTVGRNDDVYWSGATYGPRIDDGDEDPIDELKPDIVAPAVNLEVARFIVSPAESYDWHLVEGTSYATPHVSGVVALMLQANPLIASLEGKDVLEEVRSILHETAEARGQPYDPSLSQKYSTRYGFGTLDGYRAVTMALGHSSVDHAPSITEFRIEPDMVTTGSTCTIFVDASDEDGGELTHTVTSENGMISGEYPKFFYTAPQEQGTYRITYKVTDEGGLYDTRSEAVTVVSGETNEPPVIEFLEVDDDLIFTDENTKVEASVFDPDGDDIEYIWSANSGSIKGTGNEVVFYPPQWDAVVTITLEVVDPYGASDRKTVKVTVDERDGDEIEETGPMILRVAFDPDRVDAGGEVKVHVTVEEGSSDIADAWIDCSHIGLSDRIELRDDGIVPDVTQDDNRFTSIIELPTSMMGGLSSIDVYVVDENGLTSSRTEQFEVINSDEIIQDPPERDGSQNRWIIGLTVGAIVIGAILLMIVVIRRKP